MNIEIFISQSLLRHIFYRDRQGEIEKKSFLKISLNLKIDFFKFFNLKLLF